LKQPVRGQYVLVGTLSAVDDAGNITLIVREEPLQITFSSIDQARLVFEWQKGETRGGHVPGRSAKAARGKRPRVRNGASE
jgi:hypothetical protein